MSTFQGYRHLFTVAEDGSRGRLGFQSIACSDPIEAVVDELERLVGSYHAPSASAEARRDGRQLLQMYDEGYYALTTFTPLDRSPDGRGGNYWAETWVVPAGWLEEGGWDLAAAFDSLPWDGPEDLEQFSGWPCSLGSGEELPELAPGPLERLDLLRRAVPEVLLPDLVQSVAQLTRTRRTLQVLAAKERDGEELGRLVLLLPLVLPPVARRFPVGDRLRTFQLRTWTRPGERPEVDVAGLPASARDAAEGAGGHTVDLSGRRRPDPPKDALGAQYAEWAAGAVASGDWEGLGSLYRRAATAGSAGAFLESFPEIATDRGSIAVGAPEPTPAAHPSAQSVPATAAPSALDQRHQEWLTRADLDAALSEQRRRLHDQIDETITALRAHTDQAAGDLAIRLREQTDAVTNELRNQSEALKAGLDGSVSDWRKLLAEEKKELERLEAELRQQREQAVEGLKGAEKEIRDGLAAERSEWIESLQATALSAAREAVARAVREIQLEVGGSPEKPEIRATQVEELDEGREGGRRVLGGLLNRLGFGSKELDGGGASKEPRGTDEEAGAPAPPEDDPRKGQRIPVEEPRRRMGRKPLGWKVPAAVGAVVILAVALLSYFPHFRPGTNDAAPSNAGGTPQPTVVPAELETRLRDGELAARLLARASRESNPSAAASVLYLDLFLDQASPAPGGVEVALTQKALGLSVDGVFGNTSLSNLRQRIETNCCSDFTERRGQISCFLDFHLGFGEGRACAGLAPFGEINDWDYERSARMLTLLQETRNAAASGGDAANLSDQGRRDRLDLADRLDGYHLAAAEDRLARARQVANTQIDEGEAARLLRLARAVVLESTWEEVPREPGSEELERVQALLDELASGEPADAKAGAVPAGERDRPGTESSP